MTTKNDTSEDRRVRDRASVSLHPVKGFTLDKRFLFDGAMMDRSADGAMVRLYGAVPENRPIHLYDEVTGRRWRARLVWARGSQAGFSFESVPEGIGKRESARVFGRYYAVVH